MRGAVVVPDTAVHHGHATVPVSIAGAAVAPGHVVPAVVHRVGAPARVLLSAVVVVHAAVRHGDAGQAVDGNHGAIVQGGLDQVAIVRGDVENLCRGHAEGSCQGEKC